MELTKNWYRILIILCAPILFSLLGYLYPFSVSYIAYYFNDPFALYQLPGYYVEAFSLVLIWASALLVARLILNSINELE